MKQLFCTVVTDFNGVLESPIVFHIKAENQEKAEACARELLIEYNYDDNQIDDNFDLFTFPVTDSDITEA